MWTRHALVWRKLLGPSLLGNFGEPLLYLLAFGYGFGRLIGEVDGVPYLIFIASGVLCSSAMFSASFEGMYSAYTRMAEQNVWAGMLATPIGLDDIVTAEVLWAASKGLISVLAMLLVALMLGLIADARILLALPILLLAGAVFGSLALVITAFARNYDFFLYYFTLAVTPMLLLSGVFFPLSEFPPLLQQLAQILPLVHVVEIVRPLFLGEWPNAIAVHLGVLIVYGVIALGLANALLHRRLMR
ncbi:MAG: ABC transporter permease [Thioalkalivibrionaceae bacterium]